MIWQALTVFAPLLVLLLAAAFLDLRTRRIPDALCGLIALTGMMQTFTRYATVRPADAILGLLLGFALTGALFALGALGGGDVKLLSGAGTWLGARGVFQIFLAAAIIGLLMVLIQAACQRRLGALWRNSVLIMATLVHIQELGAQHAADAGANCRSINKPLPYAVPVLLATVLMVCMGRALP